MNKQIQSGIKELIPTPPLIPTVLLCPDCGTPWSADYIDYMWMRENDLIICSCGKSLCEVKELKIE